MVEELQNFGSNIGCCPESLQNFAASRRVDLQDPQADCFELNCNCVDVLDSTKKK